MSAAPRSREPVATVSRARKIAMAALAALLVWSIATRSLVAYLAEHHPQLALYLSPGDPVALLSLADTAVLAEAVRREVLERKAVAAAKSSPGTGAGPGGLKTLRDAGREPVAGEAIAPPAAFDAQNVRRMTERALAGAPLSAKGLRILAQLTEAGEPDRAMGMLAAARARSFYESYAVYVLMHHHAEKAEYDAAVDMADALLRSRPDLTDTIFRFLAKLAEHPSAAPVLHRRLEARPPWRRHFITYLPRLVRDPRTPLAILTALRRGTSPPDGVEVGAYVDFLAGRELHELAYYTWLQFLPPGRLALAGLLYNGNFEQVPSGLPFDWTIKPGVGAVASIRTSEDKAADRGLEIAFSVGRVQLGDIGQQLLLTAGSYVLEGRSRGEIQGRRGLRWIIVCADAGRRRIGETAMLLGQHRTWRAFELAFSVPDAACRSQHLRLVHDARSESERFVTGTMWFDNLRIARVSPTSGNGK